MTHCLLIHAHPLAGSLNARLAATAQTQARAQGWQVTRRDLYAEDFDPRLTPEERQGYYGTPPATLGAQKTELAAAEVLILVFPTWWFGFPAILKGWFDRAWASGLAFDHSPGFGPMLPRLDALKEVLVITTMGAPAWIDWLVLRRPLRRTQHWGIIRPCAPKAWFRWYALYRAETAAPERITRFEGRLCKEFKAMARRLTCPD